MNIYIDQRAVKHNMEYPTELSSLQEFVKNVGDHLDYCTNSFGEFDNWIVEDGK